MAPDSLKNGAQRSCNKFHWRSFISNFFVKAVWILLVSFTLSHFNKSNPTCCKCLNNSFGVTLNVRFTTNGMCVKNNIAIYASPTSNGSVSTACDFCFCFLPQCEVLRTSHSGFLIATKWCCDRTQWCMNVRDEWTVKFFCPSLVLIR